MLRACLFLFPAILAGACASHSGGAASDDRVHARLVLLTREGCINTDTMRANVDLALQSLGRPGDYKIIDLATLPETDVRRGYPTPTLLYRGQDVFGLAEPRPPLPEPT
jgi:hypothetical protein